MEYTLLLADPGLRVYHNFASHQHMRYEHNIVYVVACYKSIRIHEEYDSSAKLWEVDIMNDLGKASVSRSSSL